MVSHFILNIPTSIHLYQEGNLEGLDIEDLGQYLKEKTNIPFHLYGNIYEGLTRDQVETMAEELAEIRVKDPFKSPQPPFSKGGQGGITQKGFVSGGSSQAEIDYEKRRIRDPNWRAFGILYEGIWYQKIVSELIDKGELDFNRCCLLFTNQLFGTWDRDNRRYHARVSIYGFPHLISTTGLVEAPAKPKGFYLKKQMGLSLELLKEEYQGRFLDHGDLRITEVLKGYAMQALFFNLSGEPFCEDPDCRLFNSHWQEEVLHSQMDGQFEFCPRHEAMLNELKSRVANNINKE